MITIIAVWFAISVPVGFLMWAACRVGARADRHWLTELEAQWPSMPDLEGRDMFSQYPIAGLPKNEGGA